MLMYMPSYKHIKNNCLFNYAIWYTYYNNKHFHNKEKINRIFSKKLTDLERVLILGALKR